MKTSSVVRTRFAPSPTGYLHVGGLRTALFSYLLAKKHGGSFVLRLEDTDRARLVAGSIDAIVDSLAWAGLSPDEGPHVGGDYGPYVQSERLELYQQHANQLHEAGHAYWCFCTADRLATVRKEQEAKHLPPRYDGLCRTLSADAVQTRKAAGEAAVLRLKVPTEGTSVFHDAIRGEVRFDYATIDDAVLLKSDGFPTYHLAVVIDDHLMNISHVIRAEEWLPSTPKHLLLYAAFGWEVPVIAHVPVLLSPKGGKLSKRDGAVSVLDYRDKGYVPEALINYLALLGWNPGTPQEKFTLQELCKEFSLDHVQKSGAIFDEQKLNHLNGVYLRELSPEDLLARAGEWGASLRASFGDRAPAAVQLVQDRLVTLADLPEHTQFLLSLPDYDAHLLIPKKGTKGETQKILEALSEFFLAHAENDFQESSLHDPTIAFVQEQGWTNALALWPLRVALSGMKNSPGVFAIAAFLQKKASCDRITTAIEKLKNIA